MTNEELLAKIGQSTEETEFYTPMPPGYRDELRELVAERPVTPPRNIGSVLVFRLGELRFALPTRIASAVAPVLHAGQMREDPASIGRVIG